MSTVQEAFVSAASGKLVDGWLDVAQRIESPNFDDRPSCEGISLVVVHAISLPPAQFGSDDIVRLFTNRLDPNSHPYFSQISQMRVSAHFLIRRAGELLQFVSCLQRAWHAGESTYEGRRRCNDFSIGIELEGCDELPFEDVQYVQLVELIKALLTGYPIEGIVGHSQISPGRKTDPGPNFQWQRLAVFGALLK